MKKRDWKKNRRKDLRAPAVFFCVCVCADVSDSYFLKHGRSAVNTQLLVPLQATQYAHTHNLHHKTYFERAFSIVHTSIGFLLHHILDIRHATAVAALIILLVTFGARFAAKCGVCSLIRNHLFVFIVRFFSS